MHITVIGAGYVGLVVSVCFACGGHQVICLEKDEERCKVLAAGQCPILEKELPQMLTSALNCKRIYFTTQAEEAIPSAEIIFIAVGTPSNEEGQADLTALFKAVSQIGSFIGSNTAVVIKSSIPPGTTESIRSELVKTALYKKDINGLHVIYNPEFLREGTAVNDFLSPDRIVVGADDPVTGDMLFSLYRPLLRAPTTEILTSPLNAEIIKYASNSYLAVRLSFVNELAGLCEKLGGSISEVTTAMGLDHRIGREYLSAGLGYGGACLPKDTRALAYIAKEACAPLTVLESAIEANYAITIRLANRVAGYVVPGGTIAIWGISFKAGTEDIRNSPVLSLINELSKHLDCHYQIFDPAVESLTVNYPRKLLPCFLHTPEEAVVGADALIIGTAWPQFRNVNLNLLLPCMRGKDIFDFVNLLDKNEAQSAGFEYHACGET